MKHKIWDNNKNTMLQASGYRLHEKRGFTLIELLISMLIFVVVISIVAGVFIKTIRTQKAITALIAANDSASLAIEQMAREMRTSNNFCGGADCPQNEISFTNAKGEPVVYKLDNEAVKRSADGGAVFNSITATNVKVENLRFFVTGNQFGDFSDSLPTKITILLSIKAKGTGVESAATNLQTTITSRRLDT